MSLTWLDWFVMLLYFAFVIGVGISLRRSTTTSVEFFQAGRAIPAWVCGLAFISANLGAQEIIGMAASGAKYGVATSHFYWIGAIPAMVFLGIFMMPFYYGSRARSVPEYLRLRFDEKTRGFNAISFALMTVFSSGISMYAMAKLLQILHIFDAPFAALRLGPEYIFHVCVVSSAIVVLVYVVLGGLSSAIYNEVLQFLLIVAGFVPLVYLGLRDAGGWNGVRAAVPDTFTHTWRGFGSAATSPMGVDAIGVAMGLGFVLSFGYWCTDFLVVQRAMAADSMAAARRTPLIAAVPKMLFPCLTLPSGAAAGVKGGWLAVRHVYASEMAQNFWTAIDAFTACFVVTVIVSLVTTPRRDSELRGLVYSLTERPHDEELPWFRRPAALGAIVLAVTVALNVVFF